MAIWFAGGYSADMGGDSTGIVVLRSRSDGSLENRGVAASVDSPSYLLLAGDVLFAAAEGSARVVAFAREGERLEPLGEAPSGGLWPCHLGRFGDMLVVANYGDGSLGVLSGEPLRLAATVQGEGSGPLERQDGPHAHSTACAGGRVLSADLGTDTVHIHEIVGGELRRTGGLALPPGTGPRDILEHPDGRVFVLGELSNALLELRWTRAGVLELERSTALPGASPRDQAAALALSGDGRLLFSALRGSDTIVAFDVSRGGADPVSSAPSAGAWPRHLAVHGDRVHVANERSGTVASFAIAADGGLALVRDPEPVPTPTFLLRG